ncbi:hypothetical protein O6H91_10G081700 [Diphasiastrum complanatum]|uniref:Uncharacterized protein n=1 Tax=Diphasiastrum complanatum TaxID=34168 RepID=A0ACC2CIW5_DIPCM|nr:hypothetical protein O6H91_10G081700 [Diphasiastrum complanatum]
MARNKETVVLLVDVGPTMHHYLKYVANATSSLVHRKILLSKSDELGLVLFGANETDNELNREIGGYENIVATPIMFVDEHLATILSKFPEGFAAGDFVSMDMIIKKLGHSKKGNKRLYLITSADSPVKDPEEGGKFEQIDQIAKQLEDHGFKFDAVVVKAGQSDGLIPRTTLENYAILRKLVQHTHGELAIVESPTSLMGTLRPRTISPTTIYRGDLELGPTMAIKVWVYKKTSQEKFPTLKKYSDKAPRSDQHATREVKLDIEYKSNVNLDVVIPPEQRAKGYRYGQQLVPIGGAMEETLKFKTEKGLKLIGFTEFANIPRHFYMKETSVFVPEPGNEKSVSAMSALARGLDATHMVAIVRCIFRQGQANVVIGVLTPNLATEHHVVDSLYFNVIPFAEDVREFGFASFNNLPASKQPSKDQQNAVDNLVRMMDLAPPKGEEMLQPERTLNPVLQRFYGYLHSKSVDESAEVPALDDALQNIVDPDPELVSANRLALEYFHNQLPLTLTLQEGKGSRRFWRDKLPGAEADDAQPAEEIMQEGSYPIGQISFDSLTARKVEEVGGLHPVRDFEALMARQDSDEWVVKAISGMKTIINDLIDSAYKGNTYDKAMACLVALRKGCVIQEEPLEFNTFLRNLASKCRGRRLNDFWEQIITKGVTVISKNEAPDSDVTLEEAQTFISGDKGGQVLEVAPKEEVDEMEALLDEVV